MKVIFLDIDGVLNHTGCKSKIDGFYFVEDHLIENLKQIIDATDAKVVLSSTWRLGWLEMDDGFETHNVRHFKALRDKLKEYDIEFLSRTPIMSPNNDMRERGKEITSWLEYWNGEEIENYVILDDLEPRCLQPHLDKLVNTDFSDGLQQRHVNEAIKILNGSKIIYKDNPGYILVENVPDCCARCDYITYDDMFYPTVCGVENKGIPNDLKLPVWCPIKPFPELLKIKDHDDEYHSGWCMGHNSCLDIIINENKGD